MVDGAGQVRNAQIFGEVAWLLARSPLHRDMPMKNLEQWAAPPIVLKQYRLYRREGRPVAFFTWAYLSPAVQDRYVLDPQTLQPDEWKSGDRLWLTDFVAPFGDAATVMNDLRTTVFPHQVGRALRPYLSKEGLRVITFHGKHAVAKANAERKNLTSC